MEVFLWGGVQGLMTLGSRQSSGRNSSPSLPTPRIIAMFHTPSLLYLLFSLCPHTFFFLSTVLSVSTHILSSICCSLCVHTHSLFYLLLHPPLQDASSNNLLFLCAYCELGTVVSTLHVSLIWSQPFCGVAVAIACFLDENPRHRD